MADLVAETELWRGAVAAKSAHPLALAQLVSKALDTRTHLVGHSASAVELEVHAAVLPVREAAEAQMPHMARWFALCEAAGAAGSAGPALAAISSAKGSKGKGSAAAAAGAAGAGSDPAGWVSPREASGSPVVDSSGGGAPDTGLPAPVKKEKRVDPLAAEKAAANMAAKAAAKAAAAAAAASSGGGAEASKGGSSGSKGGNAGGGGDAGSMPELEGAVHGQVCTRFPPEPSGYLHIGHVKAVLLNDFYARHYGGRLIVRFDDTNPSKEKDEFEQSIVADLASLGVKGDIITHTSDYFALLADYARGMISAGNAYMDDTPQEQMRLERGECKEGARRGCSVAENLERFELMYSGSPAGKEWCLRAKIDMASDNGTMRDPVLYRCNDTPHHRTGTTFKAYPTYDFACPIVDSLEGVTHALRTSEYADRMAQYAWLQQALGVRKVHIHEFSRLNFVYTLLSKRKLTWFVENGHVDGWSDPRFPTVQGVLRRGVRVAALREFILSQGASKRVNDMEWDKFWSTNKKHIDPTAPRYTALAGRRVLLTLVEGEGVPAAPELRSVPLHPKNATVGEKGVWYSSKVWLEAEDADALGEKEEVTLMKWGNVIVKKIVRGEDGKAVSIEGALNLAGDFKLTKKVTWLADVDTASNGGLGLVNLKLLDFDYLITKPKLEETDNFEEVVNTATLFESLAVGEASMRSLQRGDIVQLERKPFYRVDEPLNDESKTMTLFAIPDGKPRTIGVSSTSGGGSSSSSGGKAASPSVLAGGGAGKPSTAVSSPSPLGKK